jgi:hypothetical protein
MRQTILVDQVKPKGQFMSVVGKPAGNRREFLRDATRYGMLSLIAAIAALVARTRTLSGQTCINRGLCRGCSVFAGCGLPPALSAKRVPEGDRL